MENMKIANDSTIEGVDVFCDLWCERCPLARRCSFFPYVLPGDAIGDPAFFAQRQVQSIQHMHAVTWTIADLFKVRFAGSDFFAVVEGRDKHLRDPQIRHLVALAGDYAQRVSAYLRWIEGVAQTKVPPDEEPGFAAAAIDEVIWFKIQVQFRLAQAGMLRTWEDSGPRTLPWYLHSDGFAKASLIAIDRSADALTQLRQTEYNDHGSLCRLTSKLCEVRAEVEKIFPEARSFARPGFEIPWKV